MRVTAYDISLNDRKEWCIYIFWFIKGFPLILGLFRLVYPSVMCSTKLYACGELALIDLKEVSVTLTDGRVLVGVLMAVDRHMLDCASGGPFGK